MNTSLLNGKGQMARLISTGMLLLVTLIVGVLFYQVMVGFFVPLFLAALLVVLFRPWHAWFVERSKGRPALAAVLTTATIMIVVLLPAMAVLGIAAVQSTTLLSRVNYNTFAFALERTRERFGLEVKDIELIERLQEAPARFAEFENLSNPVINARAEESLDQYHQILNSLENSYAPLTSDQTKIFDEVRESLQQLATNLQAIQEAASETALSVSSNGDGRETAGTTKPIANEAADLAEGQDGEFPSIGESTAVESGESGESNKDETAQIPQDDFRSPEERFQRGVMTLSRRVDNVISELLGGTLRSQIALAVNPSRDEIAERFQQVRQYLQPKLVSATSATGEFLFQLFIGLGILIISLYFFLVDGPTMVRTLMRLSPLDDRYEAKLLTEFDRTSRAVVLATVLSALAQGVLATAGYYFAGFESIVLLFLVTTFMALIPFLGAAVVWVPCAAWLILVEERTAAAVMLLLYGAIIVSSADNLVKVVVLGGRSQLHPLLALLSILGGVHVFGPIGILVGPMVVVFLQTTLEILNHELSGLEMAEASGDLSLAGETGGTMEILTTSQTDSEPGSIK